MMAKILFPLKPSVYGIIRSNIVFLRHFAILEFMSLLENPIPHQRLKINSSGLVLCPPDWSHETHEYTSKDLDLWVVLSGSGALDTEDQHYQLRRGSAFILRPKGIYRAQHLPADPLTVSYTHFDILDDDRQAIHYEAFPLPLLYRELPGMNHFEDQLRRFDAANRIEKNSDRSRFWLSVALQTIAEFDAERTGIPKSELELRIEKIMSEIQEKPWVQVSVSDLADRCYCHADHFSRVFKKMTGQAPKPWFNQVQLDHAAYILRHSRQSINQIAALMGYDDQGYFSRAFKNKFGLSPKMWREFRR
jgi:AraC-like DNA-binding protein